jgi:hypothetical protein
LPFLCNNPETRSLPLIGRTAFALTPLSAVRYAPDIPVVLGGERQ